MVAWNATVGGIMQLQHLINEVFVRYAESVAGKKQCSLSEELRTRDGQQKFVIRARKNGVHFYPVEEGAVSHVSSGRVTRSMLERLHEVGTGAIAVEMKLRKSVVEKAVFERTHFFTAVVNLLGRNQAQRTSTKKRRGSRPERRAYRPQIHQFLK